MTTSGRKRSGKVTEVGDPSLEWIGMEPHWELVEALQGGTFAIRKSIVNIFRKNLEN